ncbi:hypothetical protein MKEN_01156300 [Mycena kentingensis (nom. inval.)]|nr:hypothetical protein MKEN_01156300 [Mycena kentingensis (nom. inval.)]
MRRRAFRQHAIQPSELAATQGTTRARRRVVSRTVQRSPFLVLSPSTECCRPCRRASLPSWSGISAPLQLGMICIPQGRSRRLPIASMCGCNPSYTECSLFSTPNLSSALSPASVPPSLPLNHVRCLAVEFETNHEADITSSLLAACPNLTDVAQWTGVSTAKLTELQQLRNLRRLSIDLFALFGGPKNFSIPLVACLPQITHLDVYGRFPAPTPRSDGAVFSPGVFTRAVFPGLTHLAFPYNPLYDERDFHDTFVEILGPGGLPELKVLVFYAELDDDPARTLLRLETTIEDPRFCVVVSEVSYAEDWKRGVWGGDDVWTKAEGRVETRERLERERRKRRLLRFEE